MTLGSGSVDDGSLLGRGAEDEDGGPKHPRPELPEVEGKDGPSVGNREGANKTDRGTGEPPKKTVHLRGNRQGRFDRRGTEG